VGVFAGVGFGWFCEGISRLVWMDQTSEHPLWIALHCISSRTYFYYEVLKAAVPCRCGVVSRASPVSAAILYYCFQQIQILETV
jgi:hypothetical protein